MGNRFDMGGTLDSFLPRVMPIMDRLLSETCLGVVMRQFLRALHQPVRIEPFQGVPGGCMETLSPGGEQTGVRHVLRQGMFEDVPDAFSTGTLVKKLQPFQLRQQWLQGTCAVPHRLQELWGKASPQHSGSLQQTFVCLWKTINPRTEHPLNGVWHDDIPLKVSMLDNGMSQLLQKKWIPLCFVENHLFQRLRPCLPLTSRMHDGECVLRGQRG